MIEFKDDMFPKYIFYIDEKKERARGRDAVAVWTLFYNRYKKSYYSTKTLKWRYKLVTKFGHSLQLSTRQIIYRYLDYEKKRNS